MKRTVFICDCCGKEVRRPYGESALFFPQGMEIGVKVGFIKAEKDRTVTADLCPECIVAALEKTLDSAKTHLIQQ